MFPRLRTIALTTVALAGSATLYAQAVPVAQPVAQPAAAETPRALSPVNPDLSPEQRKNLYGPGGLRPGIYQIRNAFGTRCAYIESGTGVFEQDFIAAGDCDPRDETFFYILPHPAGGFTIRSSIVPQKGHVSGDTTGQLPHCISVAREVMFGPARADYRGCSVDRQRTSVGAEDQRFGLRPWAGQKSWYTISSVIGEEVRCLDLRNASLNGLVDAVFLSCADRNFADGQQRFEFVPIGKSWPADLERDLLYRQGWSITVDGIRRSVAVAGIDIPGGDYDSVSTGNDKGVGCMRKCVKGDICRAWTWTAADFGAGTPTPMCWTKSRIGTPVNAGPANATKIVSGIVRPDADMTGG
ncbi:MAG: hypothetical protein JHD35_11270 [Sphingopyxis sp.]|nr:hypothetical protein [Sphingopyxis sp.]